MLRLFALEASRHFGEGVAASLGIPLSEHEERDFEDGEHKARPLETVRGDDCYVVQSLAGGSGGSANDRLCRLLFFLATLREHGATRVTAIVPYLAYGRKDRQTKPGDPVTTRYVAQLFEAVRTDRVIALEAHNLAAFQNAFRCETVHLDGRPLFAAPLLAAIADRPVVVASPDPGGVKRAQLFQERLAELAGRAVGGAFMEKRRSGGRVSGTLLVGDVAGAVVIVVDDMISTGGTILRAAEAALAAGAEQVVGVAAHGLFSPGAETTIAAPALSRILVSDSIAPLRLSEPIAAEKVAVVSAAPLFAEAIRRCHEGGSISALLGDSPP
ncbi:ribose-phosphate diphosphokinase [Propylenella binzhouense]|uniref:ribose-phosphate diphosphokinase n=1 Tax=Propylenella binzhouense TaxID=2555902 RepID=A0A964T4H4_9HYPH|nr:ribose-phosphate diphosphokinase [Propylenella binzhouense]MYZ48323.1 ribose-phosphate pyrophosphokinase [Propylenella binzhouense]